MLLLQHHCDQNIAWHIRVVRIVRPSLPIICWIHLDMDNQSSIAAKRWWRCRRESERLATAISSTTLTPLIGSSPAEGHLKKLHYKRNNITRLRPGYCRDGFLNALNNVSRKAAIPVHATLLYSSRSRIKGSIDSARCAGIHVASSPSNDIARITPTNTSGSRGVA